MGGWSNPIIVLAVEGETLLMVQMRPGHVVGCLNMPITGSIDQVMLARRDALLLDFKVIGLLVVSCKPGFVWRKKLPKNLAVMDF